MRTETINLQMPFPIVDFGRPTYRHTKVQKPTLIGYILLVYIKRGDGERTLADNVAEAGIKGDITDLVNDELYHLIYRVRMVEYIGPEPEDLNTWRSSIIRGKTKDFRLTSNGEKLFRDQFVPVGGMQSKRKELAFNPMTGKFFIPKPKPTMRTDSFEDALKSGPYIVEAPEMTAEMAVEYLNSVKEKELGLEKQEIVTQIDDLFIDKHLRTTYHDLRLEIDSYGAAFFCEDPQYLDYLTKQYKPQWIEHVITGSIESLGIEQLQTIPIGNIGMAEQVVLPKNVKTRHKDKACRHLIWTDDILKNSDLNAKAKDSMMLNSEQVASLCRLISPICVGVLLTEDGKLHAYEAVRLEIPRKGVYGMKIHLDVLLYRIIEGEKRYRYMSELGSLLTDREWNQENIKTELWLSSLDAAGFHLERYVSTQLQKHSDLSKRLEMIEEAMELNDEDLSIMMKNHAEEILHNLQDEVSIEDFPTAIEIAKRLSKILGSDINESITAMADHLKTPYNADQLLQTLLDTEAVSERRALELTDIIPSYLKRIMDGEEIKGSHRIAMQALRIQNALHTLRGMIGIQNDPIDYFPKRIEDQLTYQNSLDTLVSDYRNFKKKYTSLASREDFEILDRYYTAILDFNNKRVGEKELDRYTREDFILLWEQRPEEGVRKLQTRLEVEIRTKLGLEESDTTPLGNMLKTALSNKWLTNEEYSTLQILKDVRNGLAHAGKADIGSLEPDEAIKTVFDMIERQQPIESTRHSTIENREEAQSPAVMKKVMIRYPHKRRYLIDTFERNHSWAIEKLKECESQLLESISGRKIDFNEMSMELNNARMKRIIPEEVAAKIVEFNRAWKGRSITPQQSDDFTNWIDAFLSIKSVEVPE